MAEAFKIVVFSTLAAVAYGILHDQVTADVCVEYFTIAHPPVFPTESPFWLAIGWGIIATWWVGLPLGIGLATAARLGAIPKLGFRDVRRFVLMLMGTSAVIAFAFGSIGAALAAAGITSMPDYWAGLIPAEKWTRFAFAAWAHLASYGVGALGGIWVIWATFAKRRRITVPS